MLNIEISQISKKYITVLNEYNKLLKTRNEYLKMLYINNFSDKKYLDILTKKRIIINTNNFNNYIVNENKLLTCR